MPKKIGNIRESELQTFRKSIFLRSFMIFFWGATPTLVALTTFSTFSGTGHSLTPEIAFSSVVLFNIIRFPLNILPMVFTSLAEAWASMKRLEEYFLSDELDSEAVSHEPMKEGCPIRIRDASFRWHGSEVMQDTLSDISLSVPQGTVTSVIGTIGSGKSSLLATLLGEIPKFKGEVFVDGRLAYVPQQAWIMNATVRDNILFGLPYDEKRYKDTIRVCELTSDLEQLIDGDQTEIGERGINLSGGQKQRVSLARAVYQNTDIYLLDDCLSAVDAHVGKRIFNNCIMGILAKKTRILVTHQLQFVSKTDQIIHLDQGRIIERGTYEELMEARNEFYGLITAHISEQKEEEHHEAPEEVKEKKEEKAKSGKLMTTEEKEVGNVDREVYKTYLLSLGGYFAASALMIMFLFEQGGKLASDFWLARWSDAGAGASVSFYLGIYAAINLSSAALVYLRSMGAFLAGINSSRILHSNMLWRVFRAPTSFFDTTPVGRILNRFSKDTQQVDEILPRTFSMFITTLLSAFFAVLAIGIVTPFSLVLIPPMGYIYIKIKDYYLTSSREFKRLDSVSKSPIFAQFAETLHGLSTIRSYQREEDFVKKNNERLDLNQSAYYALTVSNRWLGVRIELLGTGIIGTAALFVVLAHGSLDPGLAGLSLAYSLTLTSTLNWLTRMMTDLENNMVSVERIKEYTSIPQEANPAEASPPPSNWPTRGEIEMNNIQLRYRPGLELVLKGVSMSIQPGERVGVIGRTGAGKSSLMLALFRIVELAEGSILIDGIDISELPLDQLRRSISIIPQDPTLFTGTIRDNLDPFHLVPDSEIWNALDGAHLKEFVSSQELGLDSEVKEYGENFSVGQRQLFCLARALIKKSKILVMDEATAAVDFEKDRLIQQTIRKEFKDVTILTIAHRINTILDYDKIAVMDAGQLAEFDRPDVLLKNQSGLFYKLAKESNVNAFF